MKRSIILLVLSAFIFLLGIGFLGCGACLQDIDAAWQKHGGGSSTSSGKSLTTTGIVLLACGGSGLFVWLIKYAMKD